MSPLFPTRQRAEHFDSLLEGVPPDDLDPRTSELLELVGGLRSVPTPEPRPEFVADLRSRLMAAAETEFVPAATARERDDIARLTVRPTRTRGQRRVGLALGAAAIVAATTSMAVASQSAIPGQTLYPVKRAIENTRAGFSVGDEAKGQRLLGNASGRLDEVAELTSQQDPDAELVTQTLDAFAAQADQAGDHLVKDFEANGDQASMQQLLQFSADSVDTLAGLEATIPSAAHDALLNAAQVVVALNATASQLCPDCGEPLSEVPPQLVGAAAGALDDDTGSIVGGQLPGTGAPSAAPDSGLDQPSTLDPPPTPITIPTQLPTSVPTTLPGSGSSGAGLPGADTTGGAGGGNGGNGGGGGGGDGKGGKDKPVDLSPVTDTVNNVVTGAVQGVTDALDGLTGGLTGTLTDPLTGGLTSGGSGQ
ncbi:MAG TPA: hypothetical protein DEQ43_04095 [Nocardioides bacterium]|uniref:DUF5667 domain-containing protein n=1 Tax=uncultured Nocardioides sp. TaxID=198441 RepID=UPI000EEE10EE|nr:DUF5667 domain-containing protein [uncultured Nocardioides sp.]HCB03427.1 hypothetical protein [Nocardioides sp.]